MTVSIAGDMQIDIHTTLRLAITCLGLPSLDRQAGCAAVCQRCHVLCPALVIVIIISISIIHSFYIALFSALEQTRCAHWHVVLNE